MTPRDDTDVTNMSDHDLLIRIDARTISHSEKLANLQCPAHQDSITGLVAGLKAHRWWMTVVFAATPAIVAGLFFLLRAVTK